MLYDMVLMLAAIAIGAFLIISGFRVIRPTHRAAVETFGKYTGYRESGLTWIFPIVQQLHPINMKIMIIQY